MASFWQVLLQMLTNVHKSYPSEEQFAVLWMLFSSLFKMNLREKGHAHFDNRWVEGLQSDCGR